jgi:hypothetical protein
MRGKLRRCEKPYAGCDQSDIPEQRQASCHEPLPRAVVADNPGIVAASASDYLGVRSKYLSHTEWFDIDLPWGRRDAVEITLIQRRAK